MQFIAVLAIPSELNQSFPSVVMTLTLCSYYPVLFDPGDMIYNAGEDANYLFLILKGR